LQIAQDGKVFWIVASAIDDERVTVLSDGTRVVEFPAEENIWSDVVLDLRPHFDALGIQPENRATIKLFNALHQSQAGPQELRVAAINGVSCPSPTGEMAVGYSTRTNAS
jgi:hypothetical protein